MSSSLVRRRLQVHGLVQAVGFRPFVHRLAVDHHLGGFVRNDGGTVVIEVEGQRGSVARFVHALEASPPPLARVESVIDEQVESRGAHRFDIAVGEGEATTFSAVPPDLAVCERCLAELRDPHDRRRGHAFISCVECGPRATVIDRLPFERLHTTMADFELCGDCAEEYASPADRRFHAQSIACPRCGPRLQLQTGRSTITGDEQVIARVRELLSGGAVVAMKAVGGYHIACDASSEHGVRRVRSAKGRPHKPLAVMVPDLAHARRLADVDDEAARLLTSPARPIVVLPRRRVDGAELAESVAPGSSRLGLMLPSWGLQHLLFATGGHSSGVTALVMTSGNVSGEPVVFDDDRARSLLSPITDALCSHDRRIVAPADDSVLRRERGRSIPIRISRGLTPMTLPLDTSVESTVALGGELKVAPVAASGTTATMGPHLGDVSSLEGLARLEAYVDRLACTGVERDDPVFVADAHPASTSARWAARRGVAVERVQHHHAHLAALVLEHGVSRSTPVLGVTFDGTGYGDDGTIWGGEFLLSTDREVKRVGHLEPFPLVGGDRSIRSPWRTAMSALISAGLTADEKQPPLNAAARDEFEAVRSQLETGFGTVMCSSVGRLFDAVASLVGLCQESSFEGQAAMALEEAATPWVDRAHGVGPFGVSDGIIDPAPVIRDVAAAVSQAVPAGAVAAGFHRALAHAVIDNACDVRGDSGVTTVGLTGGVFQNLLLTELCREGLTDAGFDVLVHEKLPPNDGGLAVGQVAIAASAEH